MSRLRFSPGTFMMAYTLGYTFVFFMDWPLFRFYPLRGNFNWGARVQSGIGPAITWYGLVASAGIIALVLSVCIPDRTIARFIRTSAWLPPVAAMVASLFLLRKFFLY